MHEQTLADNLQRLKDSKTDIGNAIIAKGGTVGANDGLEEFADDIMSIKNDLTSIDITENGTYYSGDETVVTSSAFPIVINDSNGTPVRHVDINGNAVQSGTPTPDNPIMPEGTGERTGNLWNRDVPKYDYVKDYKKYNPDNTIALKAGTYTVSSDVKLPLIQVFDNSHTQLSVSDAIAISSSYFITWDGFALSPNADTVKSGTIILLSDCILTFAVSGTLGTYIMLNLGSTALPYEPYGYKIPISSANTTTPVYLGEVETTRKIKKLVLTGNETLVIPNTDQPRVPIGINLQQFGAANNHTLVSCTHFIVNNSSEDTITSENDFTTRLAGSGAVEWFFIPKSFFSKEINASNCVSEFKEWLQQQHKNDTPVTAWYVLAEPKTGIVNEPLMKIGDYEDSLSVDVELPLLQNTKNNIDVNTTLKPSSASFTYNKLSEYIGYNEINVDVSNTYTQADEGKVVNNATLVPQTAMSAVITANDTYDTTLYNSIVVNVPSTPSPTPSVEFNDVNFYDYDGTIVHSYYASEFANLSAMPTNPSHDGLTAQGWNWSLTDAKTYVAKYGKLSIGQMYKSNTLNGDTLLHIRLEEGRLNPYLGLTGNSIGTVVDIDWGDGTAVESVTLNVSTVYTPHKYAVEGEYTIAISVTSGTISFNADDNGNYSNIFRKSAIPNANADKVYQNILVKSEIGSGVTSIGAGAFYNCCSLTSITISDDITSIGSYAFSYCYSLSSITIPNTVISIGGNAFSYCTSLTSITIPNGVTSIGISAFYYCYSLTSISIPDTVTSIESSSFQSCSSLSSITIPDNVTSIGSNAFYNCYALSSITIPDSITSFGNAAFSGCNSLSSITIPAGVTTIGDSVFSGCSSLSSITIPDGITDIKTYSFSHCASLTSITISDDITSIGSYAFSGAVSLSSITIPDGVTSFGSYAFQSCYGLGSIKFTRTTPTIIYTNNIFSNIPTDCIIYVPAEYIPQYKAAANYPNPSTYTYVGYGIYTSGDTLPTTTHDTAYNLTWYATLTDWQNETNPITVSTGAEAYARATLVSSVVTRDVDFVNNTSTLDGDVSTLNVYSNMKRCNVADDGTINAYDGDLTYTEDGSNGQVMVKVSKFYYKLDVSDTGSLDGVHIRKGKWSISDTPGTGFKLHPAFLAADGVTELDYFLYGAFDAVGQDSNGTYSTSYNTTTYKLGSVGGNAYAPTNTLTRATARTMATNRGTGWYNAGVKQTMALQMLFAVEYGFNSQKTLGWGIVGVSAASKTGTTAGSVSSGNLVGKTTAVNWRGIENFWGNIWNWIDGLNVNDRTPYVCDTYTFVDDTSTGYTQIAFALPSSNAYISALGYDENNDWIMLPSEASNASADSAIGDYVNSSSSWCIAQLGGGRNYDSYAGAFAWGCAYVFSGASAGVGARVMFIPQAA